jgi:hypothetical protein
VQDPKDSDNIISTIHGVSHDVWRLRDYEFSRPHDSPGTPKLGMVGQQRDAVANRLVDTQRCTNMAIEQIVGEFVGRSRSYST